MHDSLVVPEGSHAFAADFAPAAGLMRVASNILSQRFFYPRQGRPGLALPPISQRSISSKDARSSSVSPGLKLGAATMRTPRRFVCASGCNGSVAQR